jgi:hypothetical protein
MPRIPYSLLDYFVNRVNVEIFLCGMDNRGSMTPRGVQAWRNSDQLRM